MADPTYRPTQRWCLMVRSEHFIWKDDDVIFT